MILFTTWLSLNDAKLTFSRRGRRKNNSRDSRRRDEFHNLAPLRAARVAASCNTGLSSPRRNTRDRKSEEGWYLKGCTSFASPLYSPPLDARFCIDISGMQNTPFRHSYSMTCKCWRRDRVRVYTCMRVVYARAYTTSGIRILQTLRCVPKILVQIHGN